MARIMRELTHLRRENAKHYQLDDGSYRVVVRGKPWHYRDPDGHYQDIDPVIVPDEEICGCERRQLPAVAARLMAARRPLVAAAARADREPVPQYWHVLQAPYYALLPRRITDGYQLHLDDVSVGVVPVDARPAEGELVDGRMVAYRDAWPSADLILEAKEDYLKASIVLRDTNAPSVYRFALAGLGSGVELLQPFAEDANGYPIPVVWTVDYGEGAAQLLEIRVGVTAEAKYPITIDPTVIDTRYPLADALVDNWDPGFRFGTLTELATTTNTAGRSRYTYIRFSLPTLPDGATLDRAILRLFCTTAYSVNAKIRISRALADWNELDITYQNRPPYDPNLLDFDVGSATGWLEFDVTPIVEQWYSGSPNYGFFMLSTLESNYVFHSRENSNDPQLVITYSWNTTPFAPILHPRPAFDANEPAVFSWDFSDPDPGDVQTAYQLVIKRASDGVQVYDSGKVLSTSQEHTLPAGTLVNGEQYRWTVRTWDPMDAVGPYATEQLFVCGIKPTVTVLEPPDGATILGPECTIRWSVHDPEGKGQSAYRVVVKTGTTLVYDSGQVQSITAREHTVSGLQNNTSYTVELTVWDGDGMVSDPVTRTFVTDFTPPPQPTLMVEAVESWTRITVNNHNSETAENPAVRNDIYRRRVGEPGDGIRIATGVPVDGTLEDYAVASGVAYEYRVVAIGENGTTAASAWVQAPVLKLTGAWIHDPAAPANTIRQFRVSAAQERGEEWAPAMEMLHPAGREHPIAEFGEQTEQRVRTAIMVLPDSLADLQALRSLADRRTVLCYRDSAGRRIFGVLGPLRIRDERHGGYTVDLEIQAVDYDEAV